MVRQQLRDIIAQWLDEGMAAGADPDGKPWNQTTLADASGVDRTTIWRLIKAKSDVDDATLAALAKALGRRPPRLAIASDATGRGRGGPGAGHAARSPGIGSLDGGQPDAQFGRNRARDLADAFRALGDQSLPVSARLLILKRWEEDFESLYGPGSAQDFADTRAELERLDQEERGPGDRPGA